MQKDNHHRHHQNKNDDQLVKRVLNFTLFFEFGQSAQINKVRQKKLASKPSTVDRGRSNYTNITVEEREITIKLAGYVEIENFFEKEFGFYFTTKDGFLSC